MEEILKSFNIEWGLLIAQAVNFAIVLGALWFLVSKPLTKLMEKRTKDIKEGLERAENIKVEYQKLDDIKKEKITEGEKQAEKIIESTNQEAAQLKQEKIKEIQAKVKDVVDEAKVKIEEERRAMEDGAKAELAELVLLASEKYTRNNLNAKVQEKLIDEAIKELESKKA